MGETGSPTLGLETPRLRRTLALGIALAILVVAGLVVHLTDVCERTPTKSDYVSAQVTERCAGKAGDELRSCRIAVIRAFVDVPLEEMKKRFPEPEPRDRPSCRLW